MLQLLSHLTVAKTQHDAVTSNTILWFGERRFLKGPESDEFRIVEKWAAWDMPASIIFLSQFFPCYVVELVCYFFEVELTKFVSEFWEESNDEDGHFVFEAVHVW